MSRILSPPPDPRDNRAFRDWLFKVYAIINGLDPETASISDDTTGATAAIASLSGVVFSGQQSAELARLQNQVGELQKTVDRLALLFTATSTNPDQLQPILLAAQTEIGALRKRIDEVMIWQ